jgi:hypothetical protein
VSPGDDSRPTTEETAPDGNGNVMLARFYLDRLPLAVNMFRVFGLLSTIYIRNLEASKPASLYNETEPFNGMDSILEHDR